MTRSEVRVEARVRNNVLWHAIFDNYGSVAEFCRLHKFAQCQLGKFLNLKESPQIHGQWRKPALRLAEILGILVEDLFPLRLYDLETTAAVVEIPLAQLPPGDEIAMLPSPEDHAIASEMEEGVRRALATLNEREAAIVRARYGIGGEPERTYDELADEHSVTRERIRQIEMKALQKLRHPSNARLIDVEAADRAAELAAVRAKKEALERAEWDIRRRTRRW